ncbi:MAG: sterol desaturase family protein [Flavobacteriales bacterium]|nr:sterol desaturase family protein [Flavobacteriales bacterium]
MEYIILSIPLFFVLMGAELGWSLWNGRRRREGGAPLYRFADFISNMGCGIGSQIIGAFTKTVIFGVYMWVYDHFRLFTVSSTALTWITAFLLVDLLYYWFHRLSHEVNFLWAAHIVHHQSEEYNLSVALRQSWWQGLFSWWFYVPLAVLGFHPLVIVTVGAFNTLYQFWIHTKAIDRLGPLEHLLNTPSHHRVHHGSDSKYLDRNHAGTLIIWDRIFGTFQPEEEEPHYGITTPLRSWDPVRANFHYWGDLIAMARRTRSLPDKLRVFLKPPGWRPADLGGRQAPEKHHDTDARYVAQVHPSTTRYVGIQFVLLVAITSLFLFQQTAFEGWRSGVLAVVILVWVMDLGLLMENRRRALALEAVRAVVLGIVLLLSNDVLGPSTALGLALCLWVITAASMAQVLLNGSGSTRHADRADTSDQVEAAR